MSNKNLFKEAIADAKAVREAALANAKAALEEALTPKLQSMLAAKLNEMEYEEEGMGEPEMEEEGFNTNSFMWGDEDNSDTDQNKMDEGEELEEDFDLSEILAELEDEDEKSEIKEAKKEDKEEEKEEEETEEKEEESEEEETEEENVADMTIDDLKALIADIVAQEMGGEEGGENAGEEMPIDMGGEAPEAGSDSEEIDLEELLAELDALGEGEEEKEEKMEEGILGKIGAGLKGVANAIAGDPECKKAGNAAGKEGSSEWWAAFNDCREQKGAKPFVTARGAGSLAPKDSNTFEEGKNASEELEEAISTINTLRAELNEVNLLNAKLLYVNKIFKAKNLSESQKLQVITSFDKATTAKEAKVVFESLNATLTATPAKKQIKESMGFASKASGVAPKKAIVESNDVITRMQKLANIIK